MESAVANLCSPGRPRRRGLGGRVRRALEEAHRRAYGCDVQTVEYEWGETPRAEDLAGRLDELGGAKAVFLTHSETSTGVVCDLQALAAAARPSGALVVADAVSSLGAVPLEPDAWGIDVVTSGSQKALMTPPGLGIVAVSPAALVAAGHEPALLLRLGADALRPGAPRQRVHAGRLARPGADVALGMLLDEGLEAVFDRHVRLGRACREGAKAMGLELFSPDEDRPPS